MANRTSRFSSRITSWATAAERSAGSSVWEPGYWSGAMMLHAHSRQPLTRLSSLSRRLYAYDYRIVSSVAEVLSAWLPADDAVTKLDTEVKLWNHLELGSTLRQA